MRPTHTLRRTGAVLALAIFLATWLTGPVASGQPTAPSWARLISTVAGLAQEPPGGGPWVVRAYYTDRQMVAELAAWREPWEVHPDQGYLVVDVTWQEYQKLLDLGFRVEVDQRLTAQLSQPHEWLPGQLDGIPGFPCYRTVEETFAAAQAIAAEHPGLATWIDVGNSWEKNEPGGQPGYDLMVLRLSNSAVPGPKPKLFVMTAIHAREYATAELNTRFAEYLVNNYDVDPDVTWLLDYAEIHLLLVTNPDGRKWAEQGYYWRKNTDNNFCSDTLDRGVDLNRNFSFEWNCCGGSSGEECAQTYHGPYAASEPETQAVQAYVQSQFPDQRGPGLEDPAPPDATGVFLDIHSYSQLVLWPWGFSADPAPNSTALQTLGRKFAYFSDYWPEQAIGLYPTDGTTDDFAYGELGLASYVFEIGTAFFQDCETFQEEILPGNLPALLYAAKASRTPYLTPAGPDAVGVAGAPVAVALGQPLTLTATIDDTRFNHANGAEPAQAVVAAEYYLDVPPWVTTTIPISYPMAAVDGDFDETAEAVVAAIDTGGLTIGRHSVFVRGRDADGNWGAVSAAFVYVLDPQVAPVVEGYVWDVISAAPLQATVQAGVFQAETDPATGYYSMMVLSGTYDVSALSAGYAISTVTGVQAHDYQTVQQDFYLYPVCQLITDDVESGNLGWTAEGDWAITDEDARSPAHSWTDSPGGSYGNNWEYALTSPVFDLSGSQGFSLSFWHTYDLEEGYDYGYVEYSTDGGVSWTRAVTYTGQSRLVWRRAEVPLPQLDGQPEARLRFLVDTDGWYRADGWHIDDVGFSGGGMACLTTSAPTADFSSNSPVTLGQPVTFSNLSTGTLPINYQWDFGDRLGTATERDPSYTYLSTGTFTVSLYAANTRGSDSASHPVVVQPAEACEPLARVTIVGPTAGWPGTYTFTTVYEPSTATLPISYAWDNGDATDYSVRSLEVGTHTLVVSATNCPAGILAGGTSVTVSASHTIVIEVAPACVELSGIELSRLTTGTLYLGDLVVLQADLAPDDATKPYTYTIDLDGGTLVLPQASSADPLIFSHTLGASGVHTFELSAWNCGLTEPVSSALDVTVSARGFQVYLPILVRGD